MATDERDTYLRALAERGDNNLHDACQDEAEWLEWHDCMGGKPWSNDA